MEVAGHHRQGRVAEAAAVAVITLRTLLAERGAAVILPISEAAAAAAVVVLVTLRHRPETVAAAVRVGSALLQSSASNPETKWPHRIHP